MAPDTRTLQNVLLDLYLAAVEDYRAEQSYENGVLMDAARDALIAECGQKRPLEPIPEGPDRIVERF